jgi:hypothetical protein
VRLLIRGHARRQSACGEDEDDSKCRPHDA